MKHKILEAKAVATDLGEFTALAAAYSIDRANERIVPGAFAKTIERWQESGKRIPLHWDHEGDPSSIIGTVDPKSLSETDEGLQVAGQLDLEESEKAREAWRLMKNDAVALSFGYMVEEDAQTDGIRDLKTLDLFEISVTPAPANPDTRFLSLKNAQGTTSTTEKAESEDRSDEEPTVAKSRRQAPLGKIKRDLILTRLGR